MTTFDVGLPGQWETAGDHERRIRALEALEDCCATGAECVSFADRFAEVVAVDSSALLGYWRLGEVSGTFADSSGQAQPADGTETNVTVAMTRDVTGALPAGQDDGAVQFNASDGADSDYITTASGGDGDRFNLDDSDMTIVAFVLPIASGSSFNGGVIGQLHLPGGGGLGGWGLGCEWPLRRTWFIRSSATVTSVQLYGPSLPTDSPTLVVVTYDSVNGHRMYYDGVLVATDTDTFINIGTPNLDPRIGRSGVGTGFLIETFYGMVDEISVWDRALTSTEISELFLSAQECTGADSGMVLTADGDGGTEFAFPTIAVLDDDAEVPTRQANLNFVTSPSGFLVPEVADDPVLEASEITFELTPGTSVDGLVLTTEGGEFVLAEPTGGGASPSDTAAWMPLTTTVAGDDVLVFDADHSLIPTLVPF